MRSGILPAVIALSVLASLGLTARRLSHVVGDTALDEATTALRSEFRAGDLIVVDPWYQVGIRQRVGDLTLLEPRHLDASDLEAYRRVHWVKLHALGAAIDFGALFARVGKLTAERHFDGIDVVTYQLPEPPRVVFDLRSEIESVQVEARYPDGFEAKCDRFERDRWICPRNSDWNYVGRETIDIDDQPRDCVWMHPLNQHGVLRIKLPALPPTPGAVIEGGYGLAREASRRARQPVEVAVKSGDHEVLHLVQPVRWGWSTYRQELPANLQPLTLELTSRDNGVLHFCMSLRVVQP